MRRILSASVMILTSSLVLVAASRTMTQAAGDKKIVLKLTLPYDGESTVTVDGKAHPGEGDNLAVDLTKADPKNPDDIEVRYVPTPDDVVEEMCRMAKVGKDDIVYDLGCGDGRMVITAVKKFGAKKGIGIERDPKMVAE